MKIEEYQLSARLQYAIAFGTGVLLILLGVIGLMLSLWDRLFF